VQEKHDEEAGKQREERMVSTNRDRVGIGRRRIPPREEPPVEARGGGPPRRGDPRRTESAIVG
jgi:hypothetical protein